ncbi:MAG: tyrosine-type recombinase/integrase [Oscillospiraceae bacterium]|nr:tyrosine-type recombinase/integrase [Oscillospiraceae bacterium]
MAKAKSRGNGQGSAYKRGKTWEAQVIIGWRLPEDDSKSPIPIKRRKSGFSTKREALEYCARLLRNDPSTREITLLNLYREWEPFYAPRVTQQTLDGYTRAFNHFRDLHSLRLSTITAVDLQKCVTECPAGKRTRSLMKTTAGLLWKFAIDCGYAQHNIATNLYTGKDTSIQREPITSEELAVIRSAIDTHPYADYIYALCFLGFRPSEFLALKKSDYHEENGIAYLVGGSKTDAGRNRRVVIPAQIAPIIARRLSVEGTDLLFPMVTRTHTGVVTSYKQMSNDYFNVHVFKPLMKSLGIAEGKVPYSARHTYSDLLKTASGDSKAKAALIGHTDYDFTQRHYQSTTLEDLKTVVESFG